MTTQSDKAARLFQFLAQVRRLREHTTTDIKGFEDRGGVVWLSDVAHNTAANGWPVRVNALLWQRLGLLDEAGCGRGDHEAGELLAGKVGRVGCGEAVSGRV